MDQANHGGGRPSIIEAGPPYFVANFRCGGDCDGHCDGHGADDVCVPDPVLVVLRVSGVRETYRFISVFGGRSLGLGTTLGRSEGQAIKMEYPGHSIRQGNAGLSASRRKEWLSSRVL